MFLLSLATVGLRSRAFPRWIALTGYAFGVVLMMIVTIWDWVVLVLPGMGRGRQPLHPSPRAIRAETRPEPRADPRRG